MNVAFLAQQSALDFDIPITPQKTYGSVLTLGLVQSAGAGSDTVQVQASWDGTNYSVVTGTNLSDGSADNAPAATGTWRFDITGIPHVRIAKNGTTDTFSAWYELSIG